MVARHPAQQSKARPGVLVFFHADNRSRLCWRIAASWSASARHTEATEGY
ncbi:hypothetical protein SAMN05444320_104329 [Streptoalloteichus hindustanus]|uniref:Uncharacterized protein n=1 Tax=Streptoalloteichus hindustanus TaxID=2017 RepID=A0A1M5D769_STRHI|nr:hypothetical protein SAMN05444320_104329 [Streptoalloteichus hindustanus]